MSKRLTTSKIKTRLFIENEDYTKTKTEYLAYYGENNPKTNEKCQVFRVGCRHSGKYGPQCDTTMLVYFYCYLQ